MRMRKILLNVAVIMLMVLLYGLPVFAFGFEDVDYWVGKGSSQAVLVIDWNETENSNSLVWGYQWDGAATGRDMLNAIKTSDLRLFEPTDSYGGGTVYGLGYDTDGDGFEYVAGSNDTGHAADADDLYKEGWISAGYWSYWLKNDQADWGYAMEGLATRKLSDGSWDGWVFAPAPSWDGGKPNNLIAAQSTAAVPEPSSLLVLLASVGSFAFSRKNRWLCA